MAITSFIPKLREYRKARKDRIAAQKEYEELVEKKQKEALDNKLKEIDVKYMDKKNFKIYAPLVLLCDGKYLENVENFYKECKRKVLYRFTTNNYRKMHHLTMRRKGV